MPDLSSLAAQPLLVDGVEFRIAPLGGFAITDHLVVVKPPDAIDAYRRLLERFDHPRMVELGIAYGGSVGLFALLAQPTRLVGLELASKRVALLDDLIANRGLDDSVHLHYGVDQAHRERLAQIIAKEFGDQLLDLVIDDASHLYHETVATFEVLFPRLRPGGQLHHRGLELRPRHPLSARQCTERPRLTSSTLGRRGPGRRGGIRQHRSGGPDRDRGRRHLRGSLEHVRQLAAVAPRLPARSGPGRARLVHRLGLHELVLDRGPAQRRAASREVHLGNSLSRPLRYARPMNRL